MLGSSGAAEPARRSTAFLVAGSIAIDAGALASGLPLSAQRRVRTVLLTHRHFDHLRELPLFLDNVCAGGAAPVAIGCEAGTRRALFRHVFNGELWPDLRRFSPPAARFFDVRAGKTFGLGGLRVTPIRMRHTVPTVGYVFRKGGAAAAILGDTGFSERVFHSLARIAGLALLVVEVSYPSRLVKLAGCALHLTPALLERGLGIVRRSHPRLRVLATHLKPHWAAEVERALRRLRPKIEVARDGGRYRLLG